MRNDNLSTLREGDSVLCVKSMFCPFSGAPLFEKGVEYRVYRTNESGRMALRAPDSTRYSYYPIVSPDRFDFSDSFTPALKAAPSYTFSKFLDIPYDVLRRDFDRRGGLDYIGAALSNPRERNGNTHMYLDHLHGPVAFWFNGDFIYKRLFSGFEYLPSSVEDHDRIVDFFNANGYLP